MTDIGKLKGISRTDAQNLRDAEISSVEELWKRIGAESDPKIAQVAADARVNPDKLIKLLSEQEVHEAEPDAPPSTKSMWKLYRPDVTLLAALLLLFGLLIWHAIILVKPPPMVKQVVVNADADLLDRQVIGPEDVTMEKRPQQSESFRELRDVIGHYSLETIPKGGIVSREQISKAHLSPSEIEDRHLLAVPVKAQALSPMVRPTDRISLLLSPRSSGEGTPNAIIENDAIVWAATKGDDTGSITVAVYQDDLEAMKSLLGISDVFIVKPSLKNSPPAVVGDTKDALGTEGMLLKTSGAFSDPNDTNSLTLTAKNKVGTFSDNGDGTWSWTLQTEDDVANASNKVIATDSKGETASDSFDFGAVNALPDADFHYPSTTIDAGSEGFALSLSEPSDPGARDTFEFRFDCGEGTYGNWGSASSVRCYAEGEQTTLDVRAQVRDDDGGVNKEYTGSVQVSRAPVSPPSPGDPVDTDSNGFQKPPVLTSTETTSGGQVTVEGHLITVPSRPCTIRFFSNGGTTGSSRAFIGKKKIVAEADRDSSFTFSTKAVSSGRTLTARATNAWGNTSEFSAPRIVSASSKRFRELGVKGAAVQ